MQTIDDLQVVRPSGSKRIVLLSDEESLKARQIEGAQVVLVGESTARIAATLKLYLQKEEIPDAAKRLGLSRTTIQRMREAFGIAGQYDGRSRTTRWREESEQ